MFEKNERAGKEALIRDQRENLLDKNIFLIKSRKAITELLKLNFLPLLLKIKNIEIKDCRKFLKT